MAEESKQAGNDRQNEIDALFDDCYDKGLEEICLILTDFGVSQSKLDQLIRTYLCARPEVFASRGVIETCLMIARKGASSSAVEPLIARCLELGKISQANELAKIIGRELTVEEIRGMRKHMTRWVEERKKVVDGLGKLNLSLEKLNSSLELMQRTL